MGRKPKRKEITLDSIKDERCEKLEKKYSKAKSIMDQRCFKHKFYTRVSHMQSLYGSESEKLVSEGSTQAIKRKIRAQTIQRVPDGDILTQYDKNSVEQVLIEFIFKNKVVSSEFDGKDMLKNLWKTFNSAYDYGYGCVRTSFRKDYDGDVRICYEHIGWRDIYPAPDCDFIEEAPWYIVREYISRSDLKQLISCDDVLLDSTYNEDVLRYIIDNEIKDGADPLRQKLADEKNAVTPIESIEVRTLYERGKKKFVSWVPSINAVLREVDNEDPRMDVPIHFMILEPDPEFPLGCSSIMWTLKQQQFADAFQTLAYDTLLLAAEPPIMAFGNLANSKVRLKPRAIWQMGTNPNNKFEKWPVETTTLTQYGSILQNVSANMMKNLNVTDSTIASDAHAMSYSGTPQGVEAQQADKTITVNQYQKRVEIFFQEWANHALRSYLASMGGDQMMTVDEETRRKIFDVESRLADPMSMTAPPSIIDGNKVKVPFSELSADMLEFKVRIGSLVQSKKEEERENIQKLIVPVSQMLNAVSEDDRKSFQDIIMMLMKRLCELSDVDISVQTAGVIDQQIMAGALQETMMTVMQQQQQINGLQQQLAPQQASAPMEPGMAPGGPEMPPNTPPVGQGAAMPPAPLEGSVPAPEGVSAEFPPTGPGLA